MFRSKFTTIGRQPNDLIEDWRELEAIWTMIKLGRLGTMHEQVYVGCKRSRTQSYHYSMLFWNQLIWALSLVLRQNWIIDSNITFWPLELPFKGSNIWVLWWPWMEHLWKKYGGILYITSCLDGNEQIYPLEFGLGLSENDASYTCFFKV